MKNFSHTHFDNHPIILLSGGTTTAGLTNYLLLTNSRIGDSSGVILFGSSLPPQI